MKRFLQISLCAAMVSVLGSAASIQFTSSPGGIVTPSGSTWNINGASFSSTNTTDLSVTMAPLPGSSFNLTTGNGNWQFFSLGSLFLTEINSISSTEAGNLNLGFALDIAVNGETQSIVLGSTGFSITGDNSGILTDPTVNIFFPGHGSPASVLTYANGAQLEAVLYDGSGIGTGNSLQAMRLGLLRPAEDFYVKLWLLNEPDTTVPEPGTMALLGSGLLGLGLIARRRTAKK